MFTGIVEELGAVTAINIDVDKARLTVAGPLAASDAKEGDSIAVSGVCLTVVATEGDTFAAELMAETLDRTTAGSWQAGTRVNLERSVTPTTRLGGHIVQGHVDGVGIITARTPGDGYDDVSIRVPAEIGRYIAPKGAVAVDGISLTVIDVTDDAGAPTTTFTLGIIPTTREATTMGSKKVGDRVNIEVDVMAKYVERLGQARAAASPTEAI